MTLCIRPANLVMTVRYPVFARFISRRSRSVTRDSPLIPSVPSDPYLDLGVSHPGK
jgi:hypothetical protein